MLNNQRWKGRGAKLQHLLVSVVFLHPPQLVWSYQETSLAQAEVNTMTPLGGSWAPTICSCQQVHAVPEKADRGSGLKRAHEERLQNHCLLSASQNEQVMFLGRGGEGTQRPAPGLYRKT